MRDRRRDSEKARALNQSLTFHTGINVNAIRGHHMAGVKTPRSDQEERHINDSIEPLSPFHHAEVLPESEIPMQSKANQDTRSFITNGRPEESLMMLSNIWTLAHESRIVLRQGLLGGQPLFISHSAKEARILTGRIHCCIPQLPPLSVNRLVSCKHAEDPWKQHIVPVRPGVSALGTIQPLQRRWVEYCDLVWACGFISTTVSSWAMYAFIGQLPDLFSQRFHTSGAGIQGDGDSASRGTSIRAIASIEQQAEAPGISANDEIADDRRLC